MTNKEVLNWAAAMCARLELSPDEAVFTLVLDEYFIMPGTEGCMITYEVGTGIYHIMVNRYLLDNMERAYTVLERQMCCFRQMPETGKRCS